MRIVNHADHAALTERFRYAGADARSACRGVVLFLVVAVLGDHHPVAPALLKPWAGYQPPRRYPVLLRFGRAIGRAQEPHAWTEQRIFGIRLLCPRPDRPRNGTQARFPGPRWDVDEQSLDLSPAHRFQVLGNHLHVPVDDERRWIEAWPRLAQEFDQALLACLPAFKQLQLRQQPGPG
jgi:hypothetical protein